jgi:hypothetical protein
LLARSVTAQLKLRPPFAANQQRFSNPATGGRGFSRAVIPRTTPVAYPGNVPFVFVFTRHTALFAVM